MTAEATEAAEVEGNGSGRPSSPERARIGSEERPGDATPPEAATEESADASAEAPAGTSGEPFSGTEDDDDPSATAVFRIPTLPSHREPSSAAPEPRRDAPETEEETPETGASIVDASVTDVSVTDVSVTGASVTDTSVSDTSARDTSIIDISGIGAPEDPEDPPSREGEENGRGPAPAGASATAGVPAPGSGEPEESPGEGDVPWAAAARLWETADSTVDDPADRTVDGPMEGPADAAASAPPAAPVTPSVSSGPSGAGAAARTAVQAPGTARDPGGSESSGGSGGSTSADGSSWATRLMRSAGTWLPPLLTVEGLIMYVLALRVAPGPLRGVDLTQIDGLGLISALPGTAFAAILLMITAFFVTIAQNTDRKFLLLFQIAAITFALHGAAALIEDTPRFHTAYVHAGFVEFINRTGTSSPILDARFAWPGFFALVGFVTKAAGVTDLTTILRWTPLLSNLLYLLPFVLILRQVVATTRARWFAALLFVIVQWIGQDYFSPQGFTYAIYLAFVAIVLRWFGKVEPRDGTAPPKGRIRRLLARLDGLTPGELTHSTGVYDRSIMLIVLIGLFGTATASHQITPFMMLGVLTGLILLRRTSLSWGLPFFLGLMVLAWISYQTVTFWSGHIDQLFGGLGRILENLQSNTGDRIEGSDGRHAIVLMARLGICAVILLLAATGLLRRLRRGVGDRAALLLLCVPVLALGLQSYGGEIGLRIYLFALPGACILASYAFFPNLPAGTAEAPEETVPIRKRNIRFDPNLTRRISLLLAAGFALVLSMSFLVARYGNEQFERVSSGEVQAMHYIYKHDEPSGRVLFLVPTVGNEVTPSIPWGERDFDKIEYRQVLVDKNPAQLSSVLDMFRMMPPNTYLVASRGQAAYLQLNHGFPADWEKRFRAALDSSKEFKRVFDSEDAAVYTLRTYPKNAEIPQPRPLTGFGDRGSPMTPIGLAALGVTWIALFAYEMYRLRGLDRAPRTRRRILFVAAPAFLLAVAVIVERFIVIGFSQLQ
ncbi:hypothetical protein [Streptosporangium sp. NPDC051022]|uniref:hypothetical protein n=1 Tax=Streptosporangium sp. NPDC051022 TaxID=3155752 RepID=UPI003420490E